MDEHPELEAVLRAKGWQYLADAAANSALTRLHSSTAGVLQQVRAGQGSNQADRVVASEVRWPSDQDSNMASGLDQRARLRWPLKAFRSHGGRGCVG